MEQVLHDFENHLLLQGKAKQTIRAALRNVRDLLQAVSDPGHLTEEIIADYLAQRECSQSTKNQIIGSLHKFFEFQGRTDLSLPRQKHIPMKAISPITDDENRAIYQYINDYFRQSLRVVTILRFLELGLTIKELIELKWDYFKFEESCLEIPNNQGLTRKLTLDDEMKRLMGWYYEYYEVYSNNVFNLSVGKIERIFAKLNKDALGEGRAISPKLFRIYFFEDCLKKGMKLSEIQNLLGLCDIRSLRRYLKSMDKKVTVTDIGKTDMFKPNNTEIKGEKLC